MAMNQKIRLQTGNVVQMAIVAVTNCNDEVPIIIPIIIIVFKSLHTNNVESECK